MFRVIIIFSYVAICYIFGGWKKWREYYSTILYVIIGDLAYNFVLMLQHKLTSGSAGEDKNLKIQENLLLLK